MELYGSQSSRHLRRCSCDIRLLLRWRSWSGRPQYKVGTFIESICMQLSNFVYTFRSFEYLAATSAASTTPSPGDRSFTSALIWALKEFAEEETPRKFTTTELVNKIREGPFFPADQVPTLMARDPHSVQRIVLGPLPSGGKTAPTVDESPRTVPACLELRFFFDKEPQERELEELALALKKLINRGSGSLYKVYFGGLYSLIHDAARRWRNFAQSNHARPVSPISPNSSDSSSPNTTTTPAQARPGDCVCRTVVPRCACCCNAEPDWHESPGDPKRRRVSPQNE